MSTLAIAFKEWAVICLALAEGRQAIILRKGGIAEPDGDFRVEHDRFWLYPTFVHQQESGVLDSCRSLLAAVQANAPPADSVVLSHWAEVGRVRRVETLEQARRLADLHVWTPALVEQRFHYRTPGLYVLAVRVYRAAAPAVLPVTEDYAGCKSWVGLDRALPTDGATPVLADAAFADVLERLDARVAG